MNVKTQHHDLNAIARRLRQRIVTMSHVGSAPHLGSALSCVDILVAAYWRVLRIDPCGAQAAKRDRFILSKGHAAMALYATLARRGFFDDDLLDAFNQPGARLPEQPSPHCAPGVEAATGSLGHGLSMGLGMAMAGRIQRRPYRVYVLISDGECNEGAVWEAAMLAAAQRVSNLCVIVDDNQWQATGRSHEVMQLDPLAEKWRAFGWSACDVDGHDIESTAEAMSRVPGEGDRPTAIIARTVKGKGVSFMEDDNNWHYRVPDEAEYAAACEQLV